jgi:tryptophan synthase alpha chain
MHQSFDTDFEAFFSAINAAASAPTALGFGISTPEQARELKKYADGIIVGSAIVKLVGNARDTDAAVNDVSAFVRQLRQAMDE